MRDARAGAWIVSCGLWLAACTGVIDTPEESRAVTSGAGSGGAAGRAVGGSGGIAGAAGTADAGSLDNVPTPPRGGGSNSAFDAGAVIPSGPPVARSYCDAFNEVFEVTCGNGSCHSNRGAVIGDFAVGPEEAAAMVSRGSVRNAACGLIIDPREPRDSLILTKMTGGYSQEVDCGANMPVGSFEVTDAQVACVADWVEQFRE
jgi:hypothetical protein